MCTDIVTGWPYLLYTVHLNISTNRDMWQNPVALPLPQSACTPWRNYNMEWPRGVNCIKRLVAGIHCVHYIEQNDCTARFATGAMRDS